MKVQLRVLSGSRSGDTLVFSSDYISIGRHPESDLQFDPQHDLDVSARHAAIVSVGERWMLRDLGSRNGTLVNGHRITGDAALDDTDHISFGFGGPKIEFRLVSGEVPDSTKRRVPITANRPATPPPPARTPTAVRVSAEVARQTKRLRRTTIGLTLVLVVVVAGFWGVTMQQRLANQRDVAALQAQIDSMLRAAEQTVASLEGEMAELAAALDSSQATVLSLQTRISDARQSGNDARVETLSSELQTALAALAERQLAAGIDFQRITDSNASAVALVYAEFDNGVVETGTAFAVRADGVMLTSRHVVIDRRSGRPARRIGIQFADSRQNFPARILRAASGADIDVAVVQVSILGSDVPTIQGMNPRADTIRVGAPVAVIGFPGGLDSPQRQLNGSTYATASLTAGTVSKNLPDLIQINGYGSPGASGSPIFDANGQVIAVLYGGEAGSGGRIVYAVPIAHANQLLDGI